MDTHPQTPQAVPRRTWAKPALRTLTGASASASGKYTSRVESTVPQGEGPYLYLPRPS